ncbi:hypothetical protein BGP_0125 [Beggiatoa sp. PS]|nr:hypothetical protein BGP_0125 [Beggiatoa sp. PS]
MAIFCQNTTQFGVQSFSFGRQNTLSLESKALALADCVYAYALNSKYIKLSPYPMSFKLWIN